MVRTHLLAALLSFPLLVSCVDDDQQLRFDPDPLELPDALPGFTSSGELTLSNTTGTTWTLTALSFSSSDEAGADAERFEVVLAEGAGLPLDVEPGGVANFTVVFSPQTVRGYESILTASLTMSDYMVGGGGCSSGCGRDAPEDLTFFATARVVGFGSTDATFEDCTDGEDNDGDDLVDCDDPDCATAPECAEGEQECDNEIDDDGDGLVDCDDPDCFGDPACGGDEEICDDGIDNDGDGRIDCEDGDCVGDPACETIEGCEPSGTVECGAFLTSSTSNLENNWESYCGGGPGPGPGPGGGGWDGPEEVWIYVADQPGEVYVAATAPGWDLDMTVLRARETDDELVCDPDECVATAWNPPFVETEELTFFAETGAVYFIVLDGWGGESGTYDLFVECFGGEGEFECGDFIDNDGDGLVDCDDPDCIGTPECGGGGNCEPVTVVECGLSYAGNNDSPASTNQIVDWCDEGFDGWTGPEIAALFLPNATGEVTVTLDGLSDDLDLTVLLAVPTPGGEVECDPDVCVANDWAGGDTPEQVTFQAFAGTPYIFAVDGWAGAVSEFEVTIECEGGFLEECDNGVDDDGDGLVDCDDPDCAGFPDCVGGVEICDDGLDNDGDGLIDCDDLESCNTFPACDYGDGDCCTDNGDPGCENELGEDCVCAIDPYCCEVTWDSICADEFENDCGGTCGGPISEVCDNGADDDGDGLIDCDDADCDLFPGCIGPTFELSCTNGVDDDGDGFVDCDDSDCAADPNCLPGFEDCTDGIDNDGDGDVDCDDSDCTFEPACDAGDGDCCVANGTPGCEDEAGEDAVCAADPYCCNVTWDFICADAYQDVFGGSCGTEDCNNGLDDDADGLVDCDDPDCVDSDACPGIEICTNGIDDDGDGAVDCADSDCAGDPNCIPPVEANCINNIDDDGDGFIDCADSDCLLDPNCNIPGTETNCANGIDDDADGAIDCDDSDCTLDPNCNVVGFETSCTDGVDNDLDGAIDCDDGDCASFPGCVNPPETNCDNGIDDDADGWTDCFDPDCATDPECATGEVCDDFVDNDGDGDIDCDDSDCSADVNCVDPGECSPIANVGCGDTISGSNFGAGSTDNTDEYCGNPLPPGWTGPEVTYLFTPTYDGEVVISLSGLTEDLDIQAIVDDGGCDLEDCEANGWNPPPDDEEMDWFAFAGTPYFIVIDGWAGAESNFVMSITCTPQDEQDCSDGLDDDLDGDIDCDDIDCLGTPSCPELFCDDGVDNDADGQIDCNDPDCFGTPTCVPELNCVDGIDNDGDGAIDCDDSDCAAVPACVAQPEDCADGIDNDGDGDVDCDDSDCDLEEGCDPGDGECCEVNGTPGCEDEVGQACVCASDPYCCDVTWDSICADAYADFCGGDCDDEEICDNGLDDDGDGDEDCFDSDCAGFPGCGTETDCSNGFDDDADGLADCNDLDCYGQPGCPLVIFSSVDDDAADFVHFPLANHSSGTEWEIGIPDSASQTGSGPNAARTGTFAWCTGCADPVVDGGRYNAYLVAQPTVFDLSAYTTGTLELSWWHWQVSPGFPQFDVTWVDASDDGGNSASTLWGPSTASSPTWTYEVVDVSNYGGGDLTFAFRYDTLTGFGGGDTDGWYIDDVELIWYP